MAPPRFPQVEERNMPSNPGNDNVQEQIRIPPPATAVLMPQFSRSEN